MAAEPPGVVAQAAPAEQQHAVQAEHAAQGGPGERDGQGGTGWRAHAVTWLRRVLLVLVVAGAAYTLLRNGPTVLDTLRRLPVFETVLSQLAVIGGIVLGTLGWSAVVDGLGKRVGIMRGAQINLVGQLGKYVPGSVWAYLLQMELGRKAGVARSRVFTASLVQVGVGVVTALGFAVAALPMLSSRFPTGSYLVWVLPFAVLLLHPRLLTYVINRALRLLGREPLPYRLRFSMLGKVFGLQVLSYGLFGVHLWLLAQSVGAAGGFTGLLLCAGAIAVGLNAGMFVFLLPSGFGVRDGVIVAVLITALPYSPALALAVVSRVMFLLADVLTAGIAATLARWRRPLPPRQ